MFGARFAMFLRRVRNLPSLVVVVHNNTQPIQHEIVGGARYTYKVNSLNPQNPFPYFFPNEVNFFLCTTIGVTFNECCCCSRCPRCLLGSSGLSRLSLTCFKLVMTIGVMGSTLDDVLLEEGDSIFEAPLASSSSSSSSTTRLLSRLRFSSSSFSSSN